MTVTNVTILGSTGSIGTQTLEVVEHLAGRFHICGLAAKERIKELAEQIRRFQPRLSAVYVQEKAEELIEMLERTAIRIVTGDEGIEEVASDPNADIVVSAMVGADGLGPLLRAIDAGKTVAIANKEPLVMAGDLIMGRARESGATVLPIDSEHSAIFQCLQLHKGREIEKVTLTASGGPFRTLDSSEFSRITPEQALKHPNWEMGSKITIDSATLMNKGLEAIGAKWLFGLELDQIDFLVHPQSIVHSMVHFVDGSMLAQLGNADMRLPIQYALTYPERIPNKFPRLDWNEIRELNFEPIDHEKFPSVKTCVEAAAIGGTAPAALNAANEVTVQAFLNQRIRFDQIMEVNRRILDDHKVCEKPDLDKILATDRTARAHAEAIISKLKN